MYMNDGELKINPLKSEIEVSDINIVVSGTSDSIMMVEGECDFISEEDFLNILEYAHSTIKELIEFQNNIASSFKKDKRELVEAQVNEELVDSIENVITYSEIEELNKPKVKDQRYGDIDEYKDSIVSKLIDDYPDDEGFIKSYIDDKVSANLRMNALKLNVRADGRDTKTVREINIETSILARAHGSALLLEVKLKLLLLLHLVVKEMNKCLIILMD